MTEKPVLFNGGPIAGRMPPFKPELRQAIRDDRKTQTRRIVKPQPDEDGLAKVIDGPWQDTSGTDYWCPYGKPGDLRVMIEPLQKIGSYAHYRDDNECVCSLTTGDPMEWRWSKDILTSIHMPHEAARTACRYTEIRVERVQGITPEDAKAEGDKERSGFLEYHKRGAMCHIDWFRGLWDSINGKLRKNGVDISWSANPFVWCVTFRRIEK